MKTVLLLGDSIRQHYQKQVVRMLLEFNVHMPSENGRFAAYTLNFLRFWLADCSYPDIVYWNNGLWDTTILYPEDGCFTPLNAYLETILRATGATVIFATTTPTHPNCARSDIPALSHHNNADIVRYNIAAQALMERESVAVNDLYSVVNTYLIDYISADNIHPSDVGKDMLAQAVAAAIRLATY